MHFNWEINFLKKISLLKTIPKFQTSEAAIVVMLENFLIHIRHLLKFVDALIDGETSFISRSKIESIAQWNDQIKQIVIEALQFFSSKISLPIDSTWTFNIMTKIREKCHECISQIRRNNTSIAVLERMRRLDGWCFMTTDYYSNFHDVVFLEQFSYDYLNGENLQFLNFQTQGALTSWLNTFISDSNRLDLFDSYAERLFLKKYDLRTRRNMKVVPASRIMHDRENCISSLWCEKNSGRNLSLLLWACPDDCHATGNFTLSSTRDAGIAYANLSPARGVDFSLSFNEPICDNALINYTETGHQNCGSISQFSNVHRGPKWVIILKSRILTL